MDFSQVARRPSERLEVVQFIASDPSLQETDYLEWKSGFDLSRKPDAGKVAKQLVGFANRDPARASRWLDGHAYMLVGVEAGAVIGVPLWDSADIENWLKRFVGSELIYDVHYVNVDDLSVLMLVVNPPKNGDPIFSLQSSTGAEGEDLRSGSVYIRRNGKTDLADAGEISMLSIRAQTRTTALDLSVELADGRFDTIKPQLLEPSFRDSFIENRRVKLLESLPSDRASTFGIPVHPTGESRTKEEFVQEVTAYVNEARNNWQAFSIYRWLESNEPSITAAIVNATDENFEGVVVELEFPLPSDLVHVSLGKARETLDPPEPPARWGSGLAASIAPRAIDVSLSTGTAVVDESDQSVTVRFPPVHVYPRSSEKLDPVLVAFTPDMAGQVISCSWSITAKNTRGRMTGTLPLAVEQDNRGKAASSE